MKSNWQHLSLREAGISLIDCVHKTPKAKDDGYPYVAIPQIKDGRIDLSSTRKISHEDFLAWTIKAKPKAHDIVLSRRCNPGESAYVPEGVEFALGQNLVLLRSDGKKVYGPYLRWLLNSPSWWTEVQKYINVGAVFTSLKCADVPNFTLPIPPLNEQIKISEILYSIDKKIELNHQTNQTLEAMAQAIFKSWFVDFEPVKAKIAAIGAGEDAEGVTCAAMRAISGKTDDELDQLQAGQPEHYAQLKTTAELFPAAMQDSELGEVPEGWEVKQLDQIAHYQNGLALQKFRPKNEDEYLPVLKIAQLKKGFVDGEEKASVNIKPECIIDNGDVVFSWSGSLMVDIWCGGKVALNQHLFKVTSEKYPKWFYYYWTKHHLSDFQMIAAAKAVTMGHIKREHLSSALCAMSCSQILEKTSKTMEPIVEKSIKIQLENFMLQNLRDTLLPKLLSGELSVDAVELVEAEA
jgi:type I restriction enzyme S subunit